MIINVYLHKEIADTLLCFGNISDVVNRILQEAANGNFDVMDKPPCPPKQDNCIHYRVNVTEPEYCNLYSTFGATNSRISLRRLLYWFVENEIYDELGWVPLNIIVDNTKIKFTKKLNTVIDEIRKLQKYSTKHQSDILDTIIYSLGELK